MIKSITEQFSTLQFIKIRDWGTWSTQHTMFICLKNPFGHEESTYPYTPPTLTSRDSTYYQYPKTPHTLHSIYPRIPKPHTPIPYTEHTPLPPTPHKPPMPLTPQDTPHTSYTTPLTTTSSHTPTSHW